MPVSHIEALRATLRDKKGVLPPGAPNALAARIIADLDFRAIYLTGAGLTNMHLGAEDERRSRRRRRHVLRRTAAAGRQAGFDALEARYAPAASDRAS